MNMKAYREFVLVADAAKKDKNGLCQFTVQASSFSAGDSAKEVRPVPADLRAQLNRLERRLLEIDEIIVLGEALAELLLPDKVRGLFIRSLDRLEQDQGLRLRLRLEPVLAEIPWEYMYIQRGGGEKDITGFLALDPRVSIVRHEALPISADLKIEPRTRRLLLALASPKEPGYENLDLAKERDNLQKALKGLPGIELEILEDATLESLNDKLAYNADIFHFAGHGIFQETGLGDSFLAKLGKGEILLVDKDGRGFHMPADQLAVNLRGRGVQVVILGACQTGRRDEQNVWSGVVSALMEVGIPAAVAMQYKIWDEAAIAFSRGFYQSLTGGLLLDEAVSAGRLAAFNLCHSYREDLELGKYWRDWGVPVLYLRAEEGFRFPLDQFVSITRAIDVTGEQIDKNQEVRNVVWLSRAKIEDTSHQIDEMGLFKNIHDALHIIEHECLRPMKEKDATVKPRYKREFDAQSLRIQQAIRSLEKNPYFEDLVKDLLERLNRATEDFQKVVDLPEESTASEKAAAFENVVNRLDMLLSGLPASFDRSILEAANRLNLAGLVELLTEVRGTLSSAVPGGDVKIEFLTEGIDEVNKFNDDLVVRVKEHNRLQILDEKLRTVCVGKTVQNKTELENEWNRIKEARSKLKAPFSAELAAKNEELVAIERDIEKAIGRKEEADAKDQLNEYFRSVGRVFCDVDTRLRFSCEELHRLSKRLKTVLK